MITLFNYLLIFNIFAGGFVLSIPLPFEFYLGYLFIIAFLISYIVRYRKFDINLNFLIVLIFLTFFSLVNVLLNNVTALLVLRQVSGILITGSAYYLLIKVNKFEINKLFKIYLRIALIVAIIGIIQEYCYLANFKYGYDYSWLIEKWKFVPASQGYLLRVNSIFYEPSHLAITMAPALFVSLIALTRKNKFYLNKKESLAIIICYFLTFSVIAYISIAISVVLIFWNAKKPIFMLLLLLIMVISFFIAYAFMPDFHMRVESSVRIVTGSKQQIYGHLSTYALVSNAYVAFKSFIGNPLFGSGLGSHPISYSKFIYPGTFFWEPTHTHTGINRLDAASLFLRLISETGLFGFIVVFYLFKFFMRSYVDKNLKIINNAIFVLLIAQLIRQGHYFYNGLFFFVWMYYFSYKLANKQKLDNSKSENH